MHKNTDKQRTGETETEPVVERLPKSRFKLEVAEKSWKLFLFGVIDIARLRLLLSPFLVPRTRLSALTMPFRISGRIRFTVVADLK